MLKLKRNGNMMTDQKRLSTEISKISSLILVPIFTIVICTAIIYSNRSTTSAIKNEFQTRSDNISNQVENILLSAKHSAESVTAYLVNAYEESSANVTSSGSGSFYSQIYNTRISEKSREVENFITQTVRQTVKSSQNIVGMGVLFEPYAFDNNIKDYAFYISKDAVNDSIQPYISYADFSGEE